MILAACAACARSGSNVVEAPMVLADASAAAMASDVRSIDAGHTPRWGIDAGWRFVGSYYCQQGKTPLELTIDDVDDSEHDVKIRATFTFDFDGQDAIHGAYTMNGTWDPRTHALALFPDDWTENPGDGWVMVGLKGNVSTNGRSISGMINGPGCTTFSVARKAGD